MALIHSFHQISTNNSSNPNHSSKCHSKSNLTTKNPKTPQIQITRRIFTSISLTTSLLIKDLFFTSKPASSFDFSLTVPDQTPEEANIAIKIDARNLVNVKEYIDSESWKVLRLKLKERTSLLKQDLYTIIQSKPGSKRPELRRLYSNLFNICTDLDNAVYDKDYIQVQECYDKIIPALDEIFAKI